MKLIDLTHIIDPDKVQRKFSIETIGAETVNQNVVRLQQQWYIMTNISMVSHIGTHIEVPYHILPEGHDLSSMPVDCFYGPAIVMDFSQIQKRIPITLEMVKQEADRLGGIPEGAVVLCNLGYADRYNTPEYAESPYFSEEAIHFLAQSGMKMMGVDAGGVEIPASEHHVNHTELFVHNIPLIENVTNLNVLPKSGFTVSAFPYPIAHVESFPVRVIAYLEE